MYLSPGKSPVFCQETGFSRVILKSRLHETQFLNYGCPM